MKNNAFTLAEVLVTLMIIGVIAAMTIPGLKKSAEEAQYVAGCQKAYSTVAQATKRVEQERGDYKRWFFKDGSDTEITRMRDYYKPYLNIVRECSANATGCWAQTNTLGGAPYGSPYGIGGNVISLSLADGTNVCMDGTGAYGVNDGHGQLGFWVDVNGDKKPNMLGVDVFQYTISPTRGLVPAGIDNNAQNCVAGGEGSHCTAKVLKEGKINY